ncbi:MAG: hypothetical protein JNL11_10845 [Bdellovibrionaceae bacterium]|nr:hypothetical protein [Pseudobdellovibrionaceae bacterium]
MKVDNIAVKPCNYVYGTPITDWRSFTSTITNFTVSSQQSLWRRVGDSMQIRFFFNLNSAVSSTLRFNMPSGYSIDAVKMDYTANDGNVGYATANRTASNNYIGHVQPGNTSGGFRIITNGGNEWTSAVPITWQSGDRISAFVEVPIVGWTSSTQMSNSYDSRKIKFRASGQPSGTLTTGFNLVTYPTVNGDTTASYSSGTWTAPTSDWYDVSASIEANQNWTAGNNLGIQIWANGVSVAMNYAQAPRTTNYGFQSKVSANSIYLLAGQTIQIRAYSDGSGGGYSEQVPGANYFTVSRSSDSQVLSATAKIVATYKTLSSTTITSGTALRCTSKVEDSHNAYNTTTGAYVVPEEGTYVLTVSGINAGATTDVKLFVNGVDQGVFGSLSNGTGRQSITVQYPLLSGDSVTLVPQASSSASDTVGWFTIIKVK